MDEPFLPRSSWIPEEGTKPAESMMCCHCTAAFLWLWDANLMQSLEVAAHRITQLHQDQRCAHKPPQTWHLPQQTDWNPIIATFNVIFQCQNITTKPGYSHSWGFWLPGIRLGSPDNSINPGPCTLCFSASLCSDSRLETAAQIRTGDSNTQVWDW